MIGRRFIVAALLLVTILSGWWMHGRDDPEPATPDDVADDFDYFLSDFELVEMDERGALRHTLAAENLYHYPDREQSALAQPRMVFYEDNRMAWEISASHGIIHDEDQLVGLTGDVRVHYMSLRPEQDFKVFTETLDVWPEQRRAETDDPVRIEQVNGTTWSKGMRARFDVRQMDLLSEVRGRYER